MATSTDIQSEIGTVVTDLQARRDYSSVKFELANKKTVTAGKAVNQLNGLKQAVLTSEATSSAVASTAIDAALALVSTIIHANTLIQKMGQLNTDRTIEPATAAAHNKALTALQHSLMELKASGGKLNGAAPEPAPSPEPSPEPSPAPEPEPEPEPDPEPAPEPDAVVPPLPSGAYEADDVPDSDEQYP